LENTLDQVIRDAVEKAQSLADKRFNFFISPSLLSYLNKASKEEGVTKSTFIRNLINDYKRKLK
jgi:predicted DNA-binding protein